jgi:hypothetical protein
MTRMTQIWPIYAAFLSALIISVGIGLPAAKALWSAPITTSAMPTSGLKNRVADADYVRGLAEHGIVKLPGYEPLPPVISIVEIAGP